MKKHLIAAAFAVFIALLISYFSLTSDAENDLKIIGVIFSFIISIFCFWIFEKF